jgi:hypothetical protein
VILRIGGELVDPRPASRTDFTAVHDEQLGGVRHVDGRLVFTDPRWRSEYLGRGEEKAVFCVCDHNDVVFALELIDERSYLNGRFVTGVYFGQRRVPGVGLIKIREYVHGYEWGRFQWRPDRHSWVDRPLTALLRLPFQGRFDAYRRHYSDVHERNVLFEVRPFGARGVPMLARDWTGRIRLVRVGLQPVDLR